MHTNQPLRESLVLEAAAAYFGLMQQIDQLLGLVGFYLDRYPNVTPGDAIRTKELERTVTNLGALPQNLADVIRRWKGAEDRVLSRLGVEVCILNEIWANVQAIVYFIKSNEISLDPFDYDRAAVCFASLIRCNRLLT